MDFIIFEFFYTISQVDIFSKNGFKSLKSSEVLNMTRREIGKYECTELTFNIH